MSTSPILSNFQRIALFTGTSTPVAYADPDPSAVRDISTQTGATAWVKIVTDAASNFTTVNLQLVDSYDGSAGSWIANTVNPVGSVGTGVPVVISGTAAVVVTVTTGKTYWIKLQTANTLMGIGGASVVAWGSGGAAKSGDSIAIYLVAAEGV